MISAVASRSIVRGCVVASLSSVALLGCQAALVLEVGVDLLEPGLWGDHPREGATLGFGPFGHLKL